MNKKTLGPGDCIGIIGGGQLGKMLAMSAKQLGYRVIVLDSNPDAPAGQIADRQIVASVLDGEAIEELVRCSDATTFEMEFIDGDTLVRLGDAGHRIIPSGKTLKLIQDKYAQKKVLEEALLPVPKMELIDSKEKAAVCAQRLGLPLIVKKRLSGYDGKGVQWIDSAEELHRFVQEHHDGHYFAEECVDFCQEVSVLIARNLKGDTAIYPVVDNEHVEGILRVTQVPASLSEEINTNIRIIAEDTMSLIDDAGVYCIEMFVRSDGQVLINEIAPRPHNSGHYSIEAAITSQYEQLVRIVAGMPLGSTELKSACAMFNILGDSVATTTYKIEGIDEVLQEKNVHVHIYGKTMSGPRKKLGHLTVLAKSAEEARVTGEKLASRISVTADVEE